MRIEDFEYVTAVYESGSIAKAAENLSISSQGLGKAIRELENEYGCRLFERNSTGTVPTEICTKLIGDFRQMLKNDAVIRSKINSYIISSSGLQRISIMDSYLGSRIGRTISQYNSRYEKNIQVVFVPNTGDESESLFEKNKLDFRVCASELITNDIYEKFEISVLKFVMIVNENNPLCRLDTVTYDNLKDVILLAENKYRPNVINFMMSAEKNGLNVKMMEAYDKVRIGKLLSIDPNLIYFCYRSEFRNLQKLYGDRIRICSLNPPNNLHIVIQSRSGEIDPRLITMLRSDLKDYELEYFE